MYTFINRAFIGIFTVFGLLVLMIYTGSWWPLLILPGAIVLGAVIGITATIFSWFTNRVSNDERDLRNRLHEVNSRRAGLPSETIQGRTRSGKEVHPVEVADYRWSDDGNFDFEVVGESYYQSDLRVLAGEHDDKGCRVYGTAVLMPENDNPHDDKAIAVYVKVAENEPGRKVGHLSRHDARSFRRRLGAKGLTNKPTLCDAVIVGGKLMKGQRQNYGVWLDMKPFG